MEKALQKFEEELAKYRKEGIYNILVPTQTIQEISPFHKPVLEIVRISSDPKAGEVYQIVQGSDDFQLRATALQKIGYAAGLIWNAKGCGRTDDGNNSDVVSYRAEAAVRKEDGTYMPLNAEYMVDLKVIEEETRDSYEKKAAALIKKGEMKEAEKKDYVEKGVRRDMLQKRKFRLQLAQTGAMDRVIRKILGLKGTYKREELQKPFVVPKIAFSPDVSDPKVREALLRQGLEATNVLYGPCETGLIEHIAHRDDQCIDLTPASDDHLLETNGHQTTKQEEKSTNDPFKSIRELMTRKGYEIKKLKKPLEQFTVIETEKFSKHLDTLPDVKKEEELPFEA